MPEEIEQASTLTTEKQEAMRILWLSNAPWAATGYGNQTRLFVPRLKAAGLDMLICAFYGLEGGVINWGGIPILPRGLLDYGQDIAPAHAKARGAKYLISLIDTWIFNGTPFYDSLANEGVRWMPWFPVDSEPLPPPTREAVSRAYKRLVYSKFGQRMVEDAGLDCTYIPHGVDTEMFKPVDMLQARKDMRERGQMAIPDDCFLVGMVAANKGNPSRKAFAEQIKAFAEFKKKHSDAILYLHTTTGQYGEYGGVNLPEFVQLAGLRVGIDVIFPSRYDMFMGVGDPVMRTFYSAMDVHMLVSSGEGFGIPTLEAQACGVPVIIGDWTAMSELLFSGWKVDKKDSHPFWDSLAAYKFLPNEGAIVEQLENAYRMRGNEDYRKRARDGALAYDANKITEKYWLPFLKSIQEEDAGAADEIKAARERMTKRIKTGHTHKWAEVGLWNADGTMSVPCAEGNCPDEMIATAAGPQTLRAGGFNLEPNGVKLDIQDVPGSATWKIIMREIERDYHLDGLDIGDGDTILDVGAHVGIVSCYLAKIYPNAKITAFEPVPELFALLERNLKANGVMDVKAINAAVTADGRDVHMAVGKLMDNSGGSSIALKKTKNTVTIGSQIIKPLLPIKLLKIDCEGAEYEILTDELMHHVDHLRGEFHDRPDKDALALLKKAETIIPDVIVSVQGMVKDGREIAA